MAKQIPDDKLLSHQLNLAWEHFKFHANQRIRMFHFFILMIGLLLSAFSWLLGSGWQISQGYALILLSIGGLLSTIFLTLDIRNTQLLKLSEDVLQKIEEDLLFSDLKVWRKQTDKDDIRLGIFSRESLLKKYIKSTKPDFMKVRFILVDNIKHSIGIRIIYLVAIFSFWGFAYKLSSPESYVVNVVLIGFLISLVWAFYAFYAIERDKKWEKEALKAKEEKKAVKAKKKK